jgi:hypothetical protein
MKKLKLNTTKLQLKKNTIVSLTKQQMTNVYGGETGPCTTKPCETVPDTPMPSNLSAPGNCCGSNQPATGHCTGFVCTWSCGCASENGPGAC